MKFYDAIGFAESVENEDTGISEDIIVERMLFGDVLRNTRVQSEGDKVNNDATIGNRFSVILDPYASENFNSIRYVKWMGRRYLLTNIEIVPPRLNLTPGGVYHGPTPTASSTTEGPGS